MNQPDPSNSNQIVGYFVQVPTTTGESGADICGVWRKLFQSKLLILGVVALATALALVLAFLMTPVYRSQILLAPTGAEDDQGQIMTLIGQYAPGSQLGSLASGSNSKDQAIAVLESRKFTEEFVNSENLLPVLFAKDWDEEAEEWKVDNPKDIPTMSDAVRMFNESIRNVQEDTRRNLVALQIDWTNPELAAHWANLMVDRLNDHLRQQDVAEARRSIEFLNQELSRSSVIEARQGISRLIESQTEVAMLANVRDEYAFKILDPAVPAEHDEFIRPKRLMIVIVGFMLGLLLGVAAAMMRTDRNG